MTPLGPRLTASIVDRPLDPSDLLRGVSDDAAGATVLFLGTVRNIHDGRAVLGIDYEAYTPMAEREMQAIVQDAGSRYELSGLAVEHRIGYLGLGEASIAIAASHARRQAALDATRYVIDEIKRRVPIWKREHYADGTRGWVDPTKAGRVAGARSGGMSAADAHDR